MGVIVDLPPENGNWVANGREVFNLPPDWGQENQGLVGGS